MDRGSDGGVTRIPEAEPPAGPCTAVGFQSLLSATATECRCRGSAAVRRGAAAQAGTQSQAGGAGFLAVLVSFERPPVVIGLTARCTGAGRVSLIYATSSDTDPMRLRSRIYSFVSCSKELWGGQFSRNGENLRLTWLLFRRGGS